MRFWICCIFCLLMFTGLKSQQRPQYSQYMLNKYAENPAYGGMERSLSFFTSYRDQYTSFPGNPVTLYAGADLPVYRWLGAVGGMIQYQRIGVASHTQVKCSYNRVFGTQTGFLSIGARVGLSHTAFNGGGIITPEGSYEGVFDHNDPTLSVLPFSGLGFTFESGAYFYAADWEAGLVVSNLPAPGYAAGDASYKPAMSAGLFGLYKYRLNEALEILPSVMLKGDPGVLQTDLGVLVRFQTDLMTGISVRGFNARSLDGLVVTVGTQLGKKYQVWYSYDAGISDLRRFNQGSHEITLSFNLQKTIGIGLPPNIIYNPRNL
jgi:type IX secretion system PorP/SprF family membrane protein